MSRVEVRRNDTLGQQDPDPIGPIIETIALLAKDRRQRQIRHDVVMFVVGFVIAFVSFTLGTLMS